VSGFALICAKACKEEGEQQTCVHACKSVKVSPSMTTVVIRATMSDAGKNGEAHALCGCLLKMLFVAAVIAAFVSCCM